MIYCPLIDDYVDQECSCVNCLFYCEYTDSCSKKESDEE
jgi:hypothetical protein